jgi:GrpB-like predicted nucleotidyltransferase (UPF0157 family)
MVGLPDGELEIGVIGGPTVHDDTIRLVEHDAAWAELFEREASRIQATLGPAALAVDHVGSTSVPGLAAKPIIDIVLTVIDASDEAAYVPALETAGYVLRAREPEWFEHRLLNGPDTATNVHVFGAGCTEIDRMVGTAARGGDRLGQAAVAVCGVMIVSYSMGVMRPRAVWRRRRW